MARITGKDLALTWNGTDLATDFQSFEVSDEMGLAEITAGDDAAASYAATYTDGKGSYQGLFDATNGTVVWAAVANGTSGTLVWYPRGTTTGYPKYTVTAIVGSRSLSFPFADAVEVSAEFQFTAAVTPGTA